MKCILLVRVSTEAQSYDEQEKEIYELAIRDGYKKEDIISIAYKESGRKLKEEERLGLNEMKNLIEKGSINCVYAWEISRIARTKKVLFSIADYLQNKRIQLVIKNPSLRMLKEDGSIDEAAEMVFTLYAQLSEAEMRNKLDRFSRGKRQRAREGKYVGGNLPYGYKINENRDNLIEINEEEAKVVRLIYDLYEAGFSQPNIPIELEKIGIFGMKISLVNHILKNRHYIGKMYKRKNAKNCQYNERIYPPIISEAQFERCRIIAANNNTNAGKTKNVYFAEDLVHCLTCGCKWSASGSKASYHCYNAYKSKKLIKYEYTKKEQCKNKTSLSINILDSLLWHIATQEAASAIIISNKAEIQAAEREIKENEIKRDSISLRLENLAQKKKRLNIAYINGGISEEEYSNMGLKLTEERNKIEEERINYDTEIQRINNYIKQLRKDVSLRARFKNSIDYLNELHRIRDEKQMYNIIHKYIESVEVQNIQFVYEFAIGKKETKAKHISIQTFRTKTNKSIPLEYIYIPFSGKSEMIMLRKLYNSDNEPYYKPDYFLYLDRFRDPYKVRLKEERRKKREEKAKRINPK